MVQSEEQTRGYTRSDYNDNWIDLYTRSTFEICDKREYEVKNGWLILN